MMENIVAVFSAIMALIAAGFAWNANRIAKGAVKVAKNANELAEKANELVGESNRIEQRALENAIADRDFKLTPQIEILYKKSLGEPEGSWEFNNISGGDLSNVKCSLTELFCKLRPFSRAKTVSVGSFYFPKELPKNTSHTYPHRFEDHVDFDLKVGLGDEYDVRNCAVYALFTIDCYRNTDNQRYKWAQAFLILPDKLVQQAPVCELEAIPILENTSADAFGNFAAEYLVKKTFSSVIKQESAKN